MSKQTLSEDDMINGLFDAMMSGNASDINKLMKSDIESQDEPEDEPASEPAADEISGEDNGDTGQQDDEKADSKEGEDTKEAAPEEDDWREKLPEDLKDKVLADFNNLHSEYQRLTQYRRSNEGRVSALQRKIDELQNNLNQVSSKKKEPEPAPQEVEQDDPILEELKTSDPALYKALNVMLDKKEKAHKHQLSQLKEELDSKFETTVSPLKQQYEMDFVRSEAEKVKQVLPEVGNIVNSVEYKTYLNECPEYVRNLLQSQRADEFLAGMDLFAMNLYRQNPMPATGEPAARAASPRADKVKDHRASRIATSTPTNRAAATAQSKDVDEAQLLEQMFQDIRKKEGYIR